MGIVVLVPCINLIASKNTLLSVKRCRWPFVFDVFPFFCVINLLHRDCVDNISKKKGRKHLWITSFCRALTQPIGKKKECAYIVYICMRICIELE